MVTLSLSLSLTHSHSLARFSSIIVCRFSDDFVQGGSADMMRSSENESAGRDFTPIVHPHQTMPSKLLASTIFSVSGRVALVTGKPLSLCLSSPIAHVPFMRTPDRSRMLTERRSPSGGGTGMGKAITQILVSNGCKVYAVGRRLDKLEAVKIELSNEPGQVTVYIPLSLDSIFLAWLGLNGM